MKIHDLWTEDTVRTVKFNCGWSTRAEEFVHTGQPAAPFPKEPDATPEVAMPRKNTKDLQEVSTTELLARYDRGKKQYIEAFARDGAEQRVSRDGIAEQGRLIPDRVAREELLEIEREIQRRTKLHDPQIVRRRLQRAWLLSTRERAASRAIDATAANAGKAVRKLDATARIVDVAAERRHREFGAMTSMAPIPKPERKKQLSVREKKILAVIRRGVKGLQYCRELDGAGIAPLRIGVWKNCPSRKYESAYKAGDPWAHRIQDEKSRVRHKAKLVRLANE